MYNVLDMSERLRVKQILLGGAVGLGIVAGMALGKDNSTTARDVQEDPTPPASPASLVVEPTSTAEPSNIVFENEKHDVPEPKPIPEAPAPQYIP